MIFFHPHPKYFKFIFLTLLLSYLRKLFLPREIWNIYSEPQSLNTWLFISSNKKAIRGVSEGFENVPNIFELVMTLFLYTSLLSAATPISGFKMTDDDDTYYVSGE